MNLVFVLAHVAGVLIPDRYSGLPTAYSQVELLYLSLFPSGPPTADVVPVNPPCTHIVGSSQAFGSSTWVHNLCFCFFCRRGPWLMWPRLQALPAQQLPL